MLGWGQDQAVGKNIYHLLWLPSGSWYPGYCTESIDNRKVLPICTESVVQKSPFPPLPHLSWVLSEPLKCLCCCPLCRGSHGGSESKQMARSHPNSCHAPHSRLVLMFPHEFSTVLSSARLAWDDAIDQLLKDILRTPLYASIHHPPEGHSFCLKPSFSEITLNSLKNEPTTHYYDSIFYGKKSSCVFPQTKCLLRSLSLFYSYEKLTW